MFRFGKSERRDSSRAPLSRRNPTRARGVGWEGGRVTKLPRGVQGAGVARGVWIEAR